VKILWVGTKEPWPPVDGGRLLVWYTLEALAAAGHDITLVVPFDPARSDRDAVEKELGRLCRPHLVPARPAPHALAAGRAWLRGLPTSVVRHTLPPVRDEVARCLRAESFDVVHAEQVQAIAQCEPAFAAGIRVVWRAQNVESDLWAATARHFWWLAPLLRREARAMAAYESAAVHRTSATIALTRPDADRLAMLSGAPDSVVTQGSHDDAGPVAAVRRSLRETPRIHHIPAPFPAELPQADAPLPGSPAIVLFGSGGWWPNAQGAKWFLREAWPLVLKALPEAHLHVFGKPMAASAGVSFHSPPADSREAFAPGSILVVPLFVASGVRMKILEAWARGIPVVATPAAAGGLPLGDASGLVIAPDASGMAEGLIHAGRSDLGVSLATGGHRQLRGAHDASLLVALLEACYREAAVIRP
jgi:glycosyltransferase involved in cell wall biosynthesis